MTNEKIKRVKRCFRCRCLFICSNSLELVTCPTKKICYCSKCWLEKYPHSNDPDKCKIQVIKSGKES